MSKFLNAPTSSTNAIKSTITTDALVFRWFLYLINREKAKIDLIADGAVYVQLKKAIIYQNFCLIVLLVVLLYIFLTKQYIVLCAAAIIKISIFFYRFGFFKNFSIGCGRQKHHPRQQY